MGSTSRAQGQRTRSVTNADKRVGPLTEYSKKSFPMTLYLDYPLEVEKIIIVKRGKLILNGDGSIGILCCGIIRNMGYSQEEVKELVSFEALNGQFVPGRSIG